MWGVPPRGRRVFLPVRPLVDRAEKACSGMEDEAVGELGIHRGSRPGHCSIRGARRHRGLLVTPGPVAIATNELGTHPDDQGTGAATE